MNERLREALRRKIAVHNRLVRLSTIGSIIAVVFMWGAIYFIARWLVVFGATVVRGLEATLPQRFDRTFGVALVFWLVAGWVAQRRRYFAKLRSEPSAVHVTLELLLAPPRATFAVVQNIRNRIGFSEDDLIAATDFLVRVVRAGKLPTSAVAVELPDESRRDRVLTGLQLLDLIYLRKKEEQAWIVVSHPQRLLAFVTSEPSRDQAISSGAA